MATDFGVICIDCLDAHVKLWMLLIWSPTLTRTQKLEHKTGSQRLAQRSTAYPQWTMFTSLYNVPCPEMGQLRRGATGTNSLGTPISSAAVARLSRNASRSPGDAVGRAATMRGGKERVILRSRPQKQQTNVPGMRFESARLPVHRNLQSGSHVLVFSTLRIPRPIPARRNDESDTRRESRHKVHVTKKNTRIAFCLRMAE